MRTFDQKYILNLPWPKQTEWKWTQKLKKTWVQDTTQIQHETTRVQHDTTRDNKKQHEKIRVQHEETRVQNNNHLDETLLDMVRGLI